MKNKYTVYRDRNGRTCIRISDTAGKTSYIPMSIEGGFNVEETSSESFEDRYKQLPDYPIDKACKLFLNYCTILGASTSVLDALAHAITVTEEDRNMAVQKRVLIDSAVEKKSATTSKKKASAKPVGNDDSVAATKTTVTKDRVATKKAATATSKPAKVIKDKPAKVIKDKDGDDRKSASAMFQSLIMAGKLTDDEIFAAVKEEFGLDDKKRSYVSWYRNKMKKDGKNPPEAK